MGAVWRPSLLVGVSRIVSDFGESNFSSTGYGVRVGADFGGFGAGLVIARWPQVSSFRLTAVQIETEFSALPDAFFSPHLLAAAGYSDWEYLGSGTTTVSDGPSAAYGFGFRIRPASSFGLRTDATMRTDNGGWNAELRVMGGWMPRLYARESKMYLEGEVSWMVPLAGPWELVEPVYGIGLLRPWRDALSVALSVSVVHWRIPGEATFRSYLWDTRMFIATPAIQWQSSRLPFAVRVGPAIAAMGEGPDSGANVGVDARGFWTLDFEPMSARFGAGLLWLALDGSEDTRITNTDQLGLTISAALGF